MSNTERPQRHVPIGTYNLSDSVPWGWSRASWDDFVDENTFSAGIGMENADGLRAIDAACAWCVFVAILSTAAMALTHEAWSIKHIGVFEDGGAR